MRVLFLSHLVPYPLDTGAKIRAYYVLRQLVRAGHEVSVCAFSRPEDRAEHAQHLRSLCSKVHIVPMERSWRRDVASGLRSAATGTSFIMDRDRMQKMQSCVSSLVEEDPGFEVIHVDQLTMAPYAVAARRRFRRRSFPALLLDQHNAVFNVVRRLATCEARSIRRRLIEWEASKLARQEGALCDQFDHVVWVAEHDRAALDAVPRQARHPAVAPFTVIPISVDPELDARIVRRPSPSRVVFIGPLNWPPNRQGLLRFLETTWPRIRQACPEARLTVIGRHPPRSLLAASRGRPDLDVPGYVLDLTPYLREAAVLVVPLEAGGGLRVKILNAWCWGIPVVTTSMGAEGLRARHQGNLLLADTPDAFAAEVTRLLRDPVLGESLAEGGRKTVEEHYDWRNIYQAWDRVYTDLVAFRGRT
jgi:polysaccharide biosynthesis protein PslH